MESISKKIEPIVREASKLMLKPYEVTRKEGYANIVTSTDIAVQEFLCSRLEELIPGCGFICEEEHLMKECSDYTWIIDPIDGTSNFSRGIDQCAICVGLKEHDTMISGVVYLPRTEELFRADSEHGAYRNDLPIRVSERPFDDSVICTALSVYHKEYADVCSNIITDVFMHCNDIRRFGAAAPELCYVAMGRCELFFEYLLSPWDFAAASVILSEAGGYLSTPDGTPLAYDRESGVIAANSRENLETLLSITKKHMRR